MGKFTKQIATICLTHLYLYLILNSYMYLCDPLMPVRPVPLLCDPISHLEKLALLRLVLTFFAVIDS